MSVTAFNRKRREQKEAGPEPGEVPGPVVSLTAEQIDLAARCEALKLNLPDNLTAGQVKEAVEKAEAEKEDKKGKA